MKQTLLIAVDPVHPSPEPISDAARMIRDGGLVVFPTETVYGLGANALSEASVRGIFEAKGRPSHNPLIVHVPSVIEAQSLTTAWPEVATRLSTHFWPGPLTLVLPRGREIVDSVTAGGDTVAIRCPAHPVAQALMKACGVPVAAPSANRSGRLSPTRAEHVVQDLNGRVDLILDGGPTLEGIESTVIDLSGPVPVLLRPGTVTTDQLREVIGHLEMRKVNRESGTLRSPGLLSRHYAPRTPLILFSRIEELKLPEGEEIAVATLGSAEREVLPGSGRIAMPDDPKAYAARLYDELHRLDELNLTAIYWQMPPDAPEWLAVRDRLRRAAEQV